MVGFIWGDMQRRVKDKGSVRMFGERLKIYRIAAVPQLQRSLHIILNLSAQPDTGTPTVNKNTDREIVLESMQFGRVLPCIPQTIWEANNTKGPV